MKGASGNKLLILNLIVAATASGSAGFFNTLSMRYTEIKKGISIYKDSEMTEQIGTSSKCAQRAVLQTATSRFGMSWIGLIIPTALMVIFRAPSYKKGARFGVELMCVGAGIYCSMPISIALFPSQCKMQGSSLEKEFQNHGTVYFNRGM